ncbi:HAD family hydrolase [Alginatibacterium sediminis]|uniref:HAD family hydrolase n=1 Tax=Alginatibacterium sediminis TaxID=2164068 RepID=A0A420EGF8_9ALTE|nr:HAD-IA family hydrolase [Alginatibacterium sediminis]RKF19753.1 HAD family hydrolase [Alginatibacterium sediminis]
MRKFLIFDCDGTLVESEYWCQHGLELKFRDYGINISTEELIKRFKGIKLDLILKEISQQFSTSFADNFEVEYRALVADLLTQHIEPCPGVLHALEQLKFPMSVASNGPHSKTLRSLQLTGLDSYFEQHIFSAYDVQAWKPDPRLFLHAATQMSAQASECIVIEDSLVGVEAALKAGMHCIYYDPQSLGFKSSQVTIINHMNQLVEAVTKI